MPGLLAIEVKSERVANEVTTPVTLDGELVDSKCYLGTMKPGDGKTHKSCAILCLRGGIPPLFVSKAAAQYATTLPPIRTAGPSAKAISSTSASP